MTDFLLELRSEEIPARMQDKARDDLARLFAAELDKAGLKAGEVETFATPRRLALIARNLPEKTEPLQIETKGPRVGAPQQALDGFLNRYMLSKDQLIERDGIYFAQRLAPGQLTSQILAEAIPTIIRTFPWPKSQRWGAASTSTESLRWVRPLQGIIALLGDDLVPCEIDGITSGSTTMGHRFHHKGDITIGNAADYAMKLRAAHVIVDQDERRDIIRKGAKKAAADAGLVLVPDEGLVVENSGLTEWPVPMLGRFDESFLDVPEEVIQLTARVNQKYFICRDKSGKLANAFVCTANIVANDGGAAIVAGNEKVLAARLSDAKFFYEQDLKVLLEKQAEKLSIIVFHEKLGTVADKVERVAKLAEWLVTEGIVKGCSAADARRAARLCKADLVTGMVGEFPELQGLMGGYYARAQGEPDAVADAIRDHYKPVGQGDDVPTAPVTVAVSLADKLDTLVGFFQVDEKPTGSKDPFALRRAAIGILSLILDNGLRVSMRDLITAAAHPGGANAGQDIANFLIDRLKVQQRDAGVRHDMIDAVVAVAMGGDNVLMVKRVKALQAFVTTTEGANLLSGYKRAANIIKSSPERGGGPLAVEGPVGRALADEDKALPNPAPPPASPPPPRSGEDFALQTALDTAEPLATAAIAREDFEAAMTALASLRLPIDAFFEGVMVNDPDPEKRAYRLGLLTRFRDAVHRVADFSKIEG
jgi:glycyl-tRNA synthetase beta chain